MKAAQLFAPGDLRVVEIETPSPGKGQVLVQVEACGICGSDIPRIKETGTYHFPTVPGHEFMGKVAAVGGDVPQDLVGRRAAVVPLIGCGTCAMCRAGLPYHCASYDFLGSRSNGGFAEYVVAPASNLVFVGDAISSVAGAMLEPISVALHSVRRPGVDAGDTVVVFGAGAIGLFVAQWAGTCGAGRVIQVDIREESLEVARRCGIDTVINALHENVVEKVSQLTHVRGADLAVEAAGAAESTADAFRCVRRRGRVSLIGRIDGDWTMPEDVLTGFMRKEQTLFGNWGFDACPFPASDWDVAVDALESGRIVVDPLISHTFVLEDVHEAIQLMAEGREYFCKVVLVFPSSGRVV